MSNTSGGFCYDPLAEGPDCIRILTLCPKQDDTGIVCKLEQRTFASRPIYEALSYAREEERDRRRQITVNGQPFLVQDSLFQALDSIQARSKSRDLWIDAICINQADVQEKNRQVNLMYMVYSRAQRVLVWLGKPQDPISDVVGYGSFLHYRQNEKGCIEMAQSPYWKRAWVISEVGLAQDLSIYCGAYCFTWKKFSDKVMHSCSEIRQSSLPVMEKKIAELRYQDDVMMKRHREDEILKPLEILVDECQGMNCSEKRDKIFAFLGMATDWSDDIIQVDYGISFYELYAKTVEFQQTRNAIIGRPFDIRVPSLDRPLRLIRFSQLIQRLFHGAVDNESSTAQLLQKGERFYTARGALAGEITLLGPTHEQLVSSSKANTTWKKDLEAHYRNSRTELLQAREANVQYSRAIHEWDERQVQKARAIQSTKSYGFQELEDSEFVFHEERHADMDNLAGPRMFLGTRGTMGIVPTGARTGDILCTFWECDVAIVLRKAEDDRWRIIGRADLAPVAKEHRVENSIWHDALMLDVKKLGRGYTVGVGETFPYMMNIRIDLDTLQQMTC